MFCSNCGMEIKEKAVYCSYCGEKAIHIENNTDFQVASKNRFIAEHIKEVVLIAFCIITIVSLMIYTVSQPTIKNEMVGTWYTVSGNDDHYIEISKNGKLTICDVLTNGVDAETVTYEILSENAISVILDGTEEFKFEYSDGVIIRYEDGEEDNFTYSKEKPSDFL